MPNDPHVDLLDAVLDVLNAQGVQGACLKFGDVVIDVTLTGAGRAQLQAAAQAKPEDVPPEDDLSDEDPRFALERFNYGRSARGK